MEENIKPKKVKPAGVSHMVRLFVGLELPPPVVAQLGKLPEPIIGVKWCPAEQFHLTLYFLGEVRRENLSKIKGTLAQVAARPFTLNLTSVGCFPPKGTPKVLWSGVSTGAVEVLDLQDKVEDALKRVGVREDQRNYHPHVTLGRNKSASRRTIQGWVMECQSFRSSPFDVTQFILFSSEMTTAKGMVYKKEAKYRLSASLRP